MKELKNKPYVKEYDSKGIITNPITKEKPYLHFHNSVSKVKKDFKPTKNNKKGIRLIVTHIGGNIFTKYKQIRQRISNKRESKTITHFIPLN